MFPDNLAGASGSHVWQLVEPSSKQYMWFISVGESDATGMVLNPQQATSIGGTGAKSISGKVVTVASPGDDFKLYTVAFTPDDLDAVNGYKYVRMRVQVTGGTTVMVSTVLVEAATLVTVQAEPTANPAKSGSTTLGAITVYDIAGRLVSPSAIAAANASATTRNYSPNSWTVGRDLYANNGAAGQTFFNNQG